MVSGKWEAWSSSKAPQIWLNQCYLGSHQIVDLTIPRFNFEYSFTNHCMLTKWRPWTGIWLFPRSMAIRRASIRARRKVRRLHHASIRGCRSCHDLHAPGDRSQVLVKNIYYKWFKLNVIRDVDASNVKIYMDDQLRYEVPGHGGPSHYFKLGVYAQDDSSHCMESRWKDVKVLKKNQLKWWLRTASFTCLLCNGSSYRLYRYENNSSGSFNFVGPYDSFFFSYVS